MYNYEFEKFAVRTSASSASWCVCGGPFLSSTLPKRKTVLIQYEARFAELATDDVPPPPPPPSSLSLSLSLSLSFLSFPFFTTPTWFLNRAKVSFSAASYFWSKSCPLKWPSNLAVHKEIKEDEFTLWKLPNVKQEYSIKHSSASNPEKIEEGKLLTWLVYFVFLFLCFGKIRKNVLPDVMPLGIVASCLLAHAPSCHW